MAERALDEQEQSLARVGDELAGRYRLERRLGQGGMGTVFAARDERTRRACAVKLVRPDLAGDPELLRRFEREARTAAQLQAENVVSVTDLGEHRGWPFLVMELLEGEDLRAVLEREGRLPWPRAVDLAAQVCRGLVAVHEAGVTHRDIKPKNLFVTRHADGRDLLKILDFGVAKTTAQSVSGVSTQTGTLIGTFQYMPPEQLRGELAGARSDVYAVGAVLYEMLAGRAPFEAAEAHVLMHRIMYERPRALSELRAPLPRELYAIVERAMHPRPEERFASASELGSALSRVTPYDASTETAPGDSHAQAGQPYEAAPGPRRRRHALLLAAAIAAVLAGLAWVALGDLAPSPGPAAQPRPPGAPGASASGSTAAQPGRGESAPAQTGAASPPATAGAGQPIGAPPPAAVPQPASPVPAADAPVPAAPNRGAAPRPRSPRRPAAARTDGWLDRANPYD